MGVKRFAFAPGQPERLEVSWRWLWRDTTVKLDGVVLGSIPGAKELKKGREFILGDGSTLTVRLVEKVTFTELEVLHNGQPVPGSASDPKRRLRAAYGVIFFIGGANIVVGLIAQLTKIQALVQLGLGIYSIVFGAFFLLLGYFVVRQSLVALAVAVVLWALDTILSLVMMAKGLGRPPIGATIVRLFFLFPMIAAFGPVRALRRSAATRTAAQLPGARPERGPINEFLVAGAVAVGLVALCAVAVLFEVSGRAPIAWEEFKSPESGFSVLFPETPEEETYSIGGLDSPFVTHIFSVDLGHSAYMVICSVEPEAAAATPTTDEFLDVLCEDAVEGIEGELIQESPISLNGFPGRELTIEFEDGEAVARTRIYLVGATEYEVTAMTPQGQTFAKHAKTFLESFEFLED